ncbi:hypothetical protein C8F01DRAFT_985648 [Mycena amicta]|nr:hypothetical protein C8F01DRAFT_985648 [Mycena amicta]
MSSNLFESYGVCIGSIIISYFFFFHIISRRQSTVIHDSLSSVRAALSPALPAALSRAQQLEARAAANQLLVSAFHLTNTFVRGDVGTNIAFRQRAGVLIANTDWLELARIATQAVDASLPVSNASNAFDEFVKVTTLRVIISGLLMPGSACAPSALEGDDLREIGRLITTIWISSKNLTSVHAVAGLRAQLQSHLDALSLSLPHPLELDLLIPTWETLWRVVASCVACVERDLDARAAFLELLNQVDSAGIAARFRTPEDGGMSPTVQHYILESLRLHPPVRRIKRIYRQPSESALTRFIPKFVLALLPEFVASQLTTTTIDVCDIESAQRVAPCDVYDASRFVRESERTKDIVAFGHGPLKCIAANWAPVAAAIVVAAILRPIDDRDFEGARYRLVRGPQIGGRVGWDGWELQVAELQ